ncbi:MAG: hypothetical protein WC438_01755 [Candidatus Pacearchaeota archaeon]
MASIFDNTWILRKIDSDFTENLPKQRKKVLDVASDKKPEFLPLMAKRYPETEFTHLRAENWRVRDVEKICQRYKNIHVAYSKDNLPRDYELAVCFLTLHEINSLDNLISENGSGQVEVKSPLEPLIKINSLLKNSGKLVIIDYDLKWFNQEEITDKEAFFDRNIFTAKNEKEVLKIEENCIENHTAWGLDDYIAMADEAGFKKNFSKHYTINLPIIGQKPKMFLYIGEKKE